VKEEIITILLSVFANVIGNVIAYIICEWLGGKK
jgi:membrane protein DedA with SNARE-associated domain